MPKKIIIVGASSGIGKELAIQYAQSGNRVGITGRRQDLLTEIKNKFPSDIITACFDVMQNENQKKIADLIVELGGLDLLIYNSGFGEPGKELNWDVEERTTRTNVNGFVEIVCHCFNYFLQQGYGQIALTSSVVAVRGTSWTPAYSASKAYISNYAEGLNIKAAKLKADIAVTDLRPGFVDTKMAKGKRFWTCSVEKAATQIMKAIDRKKRVAYITKRWRLVAWIMKLLPYWLYKKIA